MITFSTFRMKPNVYYLHQAIYQNLYLTPRSAVMPNFSWYVSRGSPLSFCDSTKLLMLAILAITSNPLNFRDLEFLCQLKIPSVEVCLF